MGFVCDDTRIVTDDDIDRVFNNTNFGLKINMSRNARRTFLGEACLKTLAGYHNGSTITDIMLTLNLVEKSSGNDVEINKKGKRFLYETYS